MSNNQETPAVEVTHNDAIAMALILISEDKSLSGDELTRQMVEANFTDKDGGLVDPMDWLTLRKDVLLERSANVLEIASLRSSREAQQDGLHSKTTWEGDVQP